MPSDDAPESENEVIYEEDDEMEDAPAVVKLEAVLPDNYERKRPRPPP
jgi:hypothetical protein